MQIKVLSTPEFGIKDIDSKQQIVVGYFSSFGTRDSDGDIILPGAFKKSILERGPETRNPRLRHLLDHKRDKSVAKILSLKEDDFGLRYESKAGRHTLGQDWFLMCEDGLLSEHSIGFEVIKEEQKSDANYMHEILLYEGSSIQFLGANENTPIVGIKELKSQELNERISAIEKCLRNGKYTDEAFIQLEKIYRELKAIKSLLPTIITDTTLPEQTEVNTSPATTEPELKQNDWIQAIQKFRNNLK
jgi:HK97 family phage prohead protease